MLSKDILENGRSKQLVYAMTGAKSVPGGIAKANFNIICGLADLMHYKGGKLMVFSLLERDQDRPRSLPDSAIFKSFQGNQKAFALNLLRNASRNTLFCFDHVSLSLPLLPLVVGGLARTIIFNHGSESWKRTQKLNRLSIRYATQCLTNSHYTLRKMREHLGEFRGAACPLGLPPDFPLSTEIVERNGAQLQMTAADGRVHTIGNRMLLLVARMLPTEREKGHVPLLRVMPELLRVHPGVQLVFAGDGGDRHRFAELASELGVTSSVFLPGFLSIKELQTLYQHCFAYVMPSKQEGFGLVYLEAMNYARPCIGCFDQGTEDIVVDGVTGFLIHDQNDAQELVDAIRRLLDDPTRAREMGRNGFRRLHEQFTAAHHQARVKAEVSRVWDRLWNATP